MKINVQRTIDNLTERNDISSAMEDEIRDFLNDHENDYETVSGDSPAAVIDTVNGKDRGSLDIPDASVSDGKGNEIKSKCDEDGILRVYLNDRPVGTIPAEYDVELTDMTEPDRLAEEKPYTYQRDYDGMQQGYKKTGKTVSDFSESRASFNINLYNSPKNFIEKFSKELSNRGFDSQKALEKLADRSKTKEVLEK